MVDLYTNALSVIRQRDIACLKVQDTGTIGFERRSLEGAGHSGGRG